jgi:4-methyl-5(b-hydroxyethyl)-thiazole monophosphate biosynthesis
MKKMLVFLADGFEEIEAVTTIDYLRRAGAEVVVAATGSVFSSKTAANPVVTGAHSLRVVADMTLDSYLLDAAETLPDAVFAPGGMPGASNIASCGKALDLIRKMNQANKLVTAICAAPALVLSAAGVLEGRKWTCYPGMKDDAGPYAKTHKDGPAFITDDNLVTGRGPGAAEQFAMEVVRVLFGDSAAAKIKKGACQR